MILKLYVLNLLIKIVRTFLKGIILLLLSLLLMGLIPYLTTRVYHFPNSGTFEGDNIYNPYNISDSAKWLKANFQVQSRAWGGITDGRKNSNEQIHDIYKSLGYDIIGISDYMRINKYGQDQDLYIPIYEHGYNIVKRHQLCIGADNVTYFDFPFFQSLNHKQQIINKLRLNTDYLCLAHPVLMNSYAEEDFKKLRNYDAIEIESIFGGSQAHWDAVLSEGRYVTALGNDDAHDLSKPILVGRFFTMINAKPEKKAILEALKQGNSFVVVIKENHDADYSLKKVSHQNLQKLNHIEFRNDSLFVEVSEQAEIRFIGQAGSLKQQDSMQTKAACQFKNSDTYIRVEVEFENGNCFYLNPFVRYNGELPNNVDQLNVNYFKTWIYRLVIILLIFLNLYCIRWTYNRLKVF